MRHLLILAPILTLLACFRGVDSELAEAQRRALATPKPPAASWAPDAILHLSPELVERVVEVGVARNRSLGEPFDLGTPVGTVHISPDLTVQRVAVAATDRCEGCLAVDAVITGSIAWTSKILNGETPLHVQVSLDLAVLTNIEDGAVVISTAPRELRSLTIRAGSGKNKLPPALHERVTEKMKERMEAMAEPVEMNRVPAPHVLAARVVPSGRGVGVALRTDVASPVPLPSQQPKLTKGWQLDMSESSIVSLAAREAFSAGPLSNGLLVEPTAFDLGHERFTLHVRVWKTTGTTMWRAYEVKGRAKIVGENIDLVADEMRATATSEGAAALSPLASLAETLIFEQVRDSLQLAVPRTGAAKSGGLQSTTRLDHLGGSFQGVLTLHGDLEVDEVARPTSINLKSPRAAVGGHSR